MNLQDVLKKLPSWIISVSMVAFIIVVLERLYITEVPVEIWGIKLNQPITVENLRQVRAVINERCGIISGDGIQCQKIRTGEYKITFTERFNNIPHIHLTVGDTGRNDFDNIANFHSLERGGFHIQSWDVGATENTVDDSVVSITATDIQTDI